MECKIYTSEELLLLLLLKEKEKKLALAKANEEHYQMCEWYLGN